VLSVRTFIGVGVSESEQHQGQRVSAAATVVEKQEHYEAVFVFYSTQAVPLKVTVRKDPNNHDRTYAGTATDPRGFLHAASRFFSLSTTLGVISRLQSIPTGRSSIRKCQSGVQVESYTQLRSRGRLTEHNVVPGAKRYIHLAIVLAASPEPHLEWLTS